jgi:hypothetical protein
MTGPGTFPLPLLDDRTFHDLVIEARRIAAESCPAWTDLSTHDPGVALLEVFAHLTEVMIYRLNRLPEKAYIAFLNLLGLNRQPPAAAWAEVTFTRTTESTDPVRIPAGTRIAAAKGTDPQPVIFVLTEPAVLAAGAAEITVRAHHCTVIDGELLGSGTGQPGQKLTAAHAPITVTAEQLDLLLGVEAAPGTEISGPGARDHHGTPFQIWRPVQSFAGLAPDTQAYLIDRATGTITFSPALDLRGGEPGLRTVAAVPPPSREIRLWYRTGGGPAGNVAAGALTSLLDPLPGLAVTNREPARGGRALEPIESAIARGPYEFYSQARAVTARDFELLAVAGSAAVHRAKAFTRAAVWSFAKPGQVEVVLVPHVPEEARPAGRLPLNTLLEHQIEDVRARAERDLDGRTTLGTQCVTSWAHYKTVAVRGRVVVRAEEDPDAVRRRIHDRLHQTISPLPTTANPAGWRFGEPLRASNVYRMLEQAEPGVRYVDEIRFVVGEAPDGLTRTAAADPAQPGTWYAGSGEILFRSTDDTTGWEPVGRFPGEEIRKIVPAPAAVRAGMIARPGMLAAVTRRTDNAGARVYVSSDLGESWRRVAELATGIADLAWIDRDQTGALLLAADTGLFELSLLAGSVPVQVLVDRAHPDRGFYAVRTVVSDRGVQGVALAAQAQQGVYLSTNGGRPGSFGNIGLAGQDTRTLELQLDGPNTWLWAGMGEPDAGRPGQGCARARLFEADVRWENLPTGWTGGTCWDLTFAGRTAYAATQSAGVLRLDLAAPNPAWQPPEVNSGLPLRDRPRFDAVTTLAANPAGSLIISGGPRGVYRCETPSGTWHPAAARETQDAVTIPDTWLLCSGEHEIEVVGHAPSVD